MATKRFHRGRWEFCVQRKALLRKPVYLRFDDEAEGDAYVKRLETLLDQGVIPTEIAEQHDTISTIHELIESWQRTGTLSAADDAILPALARRVGSTKIAACSVAWAETWIDRMKTERLAPSTIRHYVGTLARAFDWALRRESALVATNPFRSLPKRYATGHGRGDVERDRRLVGDEEQRIRAILAGTKPEGRQRPLELEHGESLIALFSLALESAMRLREMYTLDIAQIDLPRRTIFLDKTKNGDKRQVPLSSVAVDVLRARIRASTTGLLFPWWSGSRKDLARTTSKLSRQFGRVFERAGCGDLRFHDLRHEATCRLYERTTLSDLQIAKITGHKDLRMLARYANLRGSDLAARLW